MKKWIFLLLEILFTAILAAAQDKTVKGTVISAEDGQPVIGATVIIKGTTIGTTTDFDGNFTLNVPETAHQLIVSYLGMQTQDVFIRPELHIIMEPVVHKLDEIVVTAFGMRRDRKALGYAAQDLKAENLNKAGTTGLSDALQGKLSGVEIRPSSGMPGASSQIVIRGARSFTGNNTPLYVVDGMPIQTTPDFSTGASVAGTDIADRSLDIDPNEIESINVLKGQAAAALYGIRASNGVIVITTKSGKGLTKGKPVITFISNGSGEIISRRPKTQHTYAQGTFSRTQNRLLFNPTSSMAWGPQISDLPDDPEYGGNHPNPYNGYRSTDTQGKYYVLQLAQAGRSPWVTPAAYDNIKDFFRTGFTFNNSLNISQSLDKSNYSFGIGTANQKGIIPETGMSRYSARGTADVTLADEWKTGFSGNYVQTDLDKAPTGNSAILATVYGAPPNYHLKGIPYARPQDPYQQINYRSLTFNNPYWSARNNEFTEKTNRFFGNAYIEYTPAIQWSEDKKLTFKYQFGTDAYTSHYQDIYEYGTQGLKGNIRNRGVTTTIFNSLLTANYEMNLTDRFQLTAMLGNEVNQENKKFYEEYGQSFNFGGNKNIANTLVQTATETKTRYRTVGFFGNLTLSYESMLFFNVTGRNDIVSSMPRNNRSFFYPSFSGAFIVTELEPLKGNPALSFLKIRASYAQVGQAGKYYDNYFVKPEYNSGFWSQPPIIYPINGVNAYVPYERRFDPDLKPQNTRSYELGADLRLFNNKLSIDYTYSRQNVKDQIFPVPLAGSTGSYQYLTNGGKIHTTAHELNVNIQTVSSPEIDWNIGFNFTKIINRVDELAPGVESIFLGGFVTPQVRANIGDTYPVIYGSGYLRNEKGQILVNEDPQSSAYGMPLSSGDPKVIARCSPDFVMGFNTQFRFRQFSFNATFSWQYGGQMYSGTNGLLDLYGVSRKTADRTTPFIYPGVKADGSPNDIQRGGPNDQGAYQTLYSEVLGNIDEYYIHDASFFKLRDFTLKYQLPKIGNFQIAVIAFARNVLIWAAMPNLDPESSQGNNNMGGTFERFSMPQTSSYGGGLQLVF